MLCLLALLAIPLGLDLYQPIPDDNPLTPEKVALGRRLFFDQQLSRNRALACATCHEPARAFADGRRVASGIYGQEGTRNVPTLINRVYGASHFWDGRASTLERQVLEPILNPKELGMTLAEAETRVRLPAGEIARALASYIRTILSGDSPFDRYINGDRAALSDQERLGLILFRGKANCAACHVGPNFTDERFHNTGIAWREARLLDEGRFTVSARPEDHGAFKTPTLREVARTAPYMHDGSLATLGDVVEYYDRGGNRNPILDPEIRPLHLSAAEKQTLIAFLRCLNGTIFEGSKGDRR